MEYLPIQERLKELESTLNALEQDARDGIRGAIEAISNERLNEIRKKIAETP